MDGVKVVVCPDDEIEDSIAHWASTLVGYVLERQPYYMLLKRDLNRKWKPLNSFEVLSRENGLFLFRFGNPDDCTRILEGGPWWFDGRLIALRKWESGLVEEFLTRMLVWALFPGLPIEL